MRHGGNVWDGEGPGYWLDFSANLRPDGPPEWVVEALQSAVADARYYPDRRMRAARRALAEYLGVPQERVLPTAGGAAAIDAVLSLRCGAVWTDAVAFGEYAARATVYGRVHGVWAGRCAPGDTRVCCNPDNPTGRALTREAVLEERRRVCAQGGEMLVDEAFIGFCPEHTVRHDAGDGLTVVGSLTKTLCIPGVRLGYVVAGPERIEEIERRMLPWAVGAFASAVAVRLPEHRGQIERDAALNRARREELRVALETLGARVAPSQANFLLADFGRDMTAAVAALRAQGILVRTCASFGLPASMLRLAVRTEEENARLIGALRRALEGCACAESR